MNECDGPWELLMNDPKKVLEGKYQDDRIAIASALLGMDRLWEDPYKAAMLARQAIDLAKIKSVKCKHLPEAHALLALAFLKAGSTYYSLGDYKKSTEYFSSAAKVFEYIKNARPDRRLNEHRRQLRLAGTYNNLGAAYERLNRLKDAIEAFKKAINAYRELIGKGIRDPDIYDGLARVYNSLGRTLMLSKRYDEAERVFDKAISLRMYLEERYPEEWARKHERQYGLAVCYVNLGTLFDELRRYDEAEEAYKNAIRILEAIKRRHRAIRMDSLDYQYMLAAAYHNLSVLYLRIGDHKKAEFAIRKAIGIYEEVKDSHPGIRSEMPIWKFYMAKAYKILSEALEALGRQEEAKSAFEIYKRINKELFG